MYLIYIATSPSDRRYVGITNNFKRRLKEHMTSPYPFGRALRKYGKEEFTFEFIDVKDVHEALELEALMIGEEEVASDMYYNVVVGGALSNVLQANNPMHDPNVVAKHPTLFSSTNNPMFNPKSKQRMIESQKRKRVSIEGKEFNGVREAAKAIGVSRQCLVHRLKSDNFSEYYYL